MVLQSHTQILHTHKRTRNKFSSFEQYLGMPLIV